VTVRINIRTLKFEECATRQQSLGSKPKSRPSTRATSNTKIFKTATLYRYEDKRGKWRGEKEGRLARSSNAPPF
jgi:hypothetical protein